MLSSAVFLVLLAFQCLLCVEAGIYVVNPRQGSVCHGGKSCTVTWLDDGVRPLLSDIGVCTVGLYTGKQELIQTMTPADVSTKLSLTFTPIPAGGPNSDTYYLAFISTSARQNNSLPYAAFSPFFRLDQMTGSFITSDSSAIYPISFPTSINSSSSNTVLPTITVGTILTSTAQSFNHTTTKTTQILQLSSISEASSATVNSVTTPFSDLSLHSSVMTPVLTVTTPFSSFSSSSSTPSVSSLNTGDTSDAPGLELSRGTVISIAAIAGVASFLTL